MIIFFDVTDDILVAKLVGEIDHHVVEKTRNDIDHNMDIFNTKFLIVDFSKVTFMDSSGIGMVLGRQKKISLCGGKMYITGCSKYVKEILHMAGVFSMVDYIETSRQGIEEVRKIKEMK